MRFWVWPIALAVAGLSLFPASAHGPSRQKLIETIDVNQPPDKVWAIIKNFDSFAQWFPGAASSLADKANEVGSVRVIVLNAPGEPRIVEELLSYDDAKRSYHYGIKEVDVKVLPVNNYTGWMTVGDNGHGGSSVEWKGAFYRGYMLNDPPPELNDDAALAAVTKIYRAGLENIKKIAETP